jgi:DNA-binding transcriptional LysR family regulator
MANIRNVNLNLLLVFDALMQEMHLSKAANKIGLSQPGMSYSLKQLRLLFNDPLFIRNNNQMIPSPKACAIYPLIQKALNHVCSAIDHERTFDPIDSSVDFKLGISDYISFVLLPDIFQSLSTLSNQMTLTTQNCTAPEKNDLLNQNALDFAIGVFDSTPKKFEFVELFKEKIVCLYDPNRIHTKNNLSLNDFTSNPHLLINFREDAPFTIQKALKKINMQRHVAMTISHVLPAGRIIANSNMIVALPERVADIMAPQYNLRTSPLPIDIQDFSVFLLWHKKNNFSAEHLWFKENILKLCKRLHSTDIKK